MSGLNRAIFWFSGAHVVALALGGAHTCVIIQNDIQNVMCWGSNSDGQLGISNSGETFVLYPGLISFPKGVFAWVRLIQETDLH